jgi:hypothetical protein
LLMETWWFWGKKFWVMFMIMFLLLLHLVVHYSMVHSLVFNLTKRVAAEFFLLASFSMFFLVSLCKISVFYV